MTQLRDLLVALAVVLVSLFPRAAQAQALYGITWTGQIITIDTTTGAGALVTAGAPAQTFGIAFRGTKLYTWDQFAKQIKELDPTTGAVLASITIGSAAFGEGDIAFRSDGIGFLADSTPKITRFDITVPSSTILGPAGVTLDGLAFSAADVLYGIEQKGINLYTVNQATGATTLVGPTGIPPPPAGLGGLAFDGTGTLYAAISDIGAPSLLYKVNPATGTATPVGNIGFQGVCGLACQSAGSAPPPSGGGGSGGGVGEGSFAGLDPSTHPGTGGEGMFGLGGGALLAQPGLPVLLGPLPNPSGGGPGQHVFNISYQQRGQAASQQVTTASNGVLAGLVLGALALAVTVGLAKGLGWPSAQR